ncbi:hypothetical protein BDV38DRAFT_283696 [Aspergillus pseudotamarii]|uniref:Ran-interacting Mog1 protein n=1 Tax=Aspergillus pseudotamarii TaxID=132259 RepID=A0A5N6SPZ5_ASPPS|nr:uncharacterized protein BDV38DRAFT_283696 [Aspergillus pseudotamarii]KAE8136758.1 hypothetical protein BDV38DRAFT_283696 [Aspergillus pseudotamarii]
MTTYTPHDFYGGAIKALIPQNWVDASDVREIPSHQEVFLSRTTLSSQITEINQRVTDHETATLDTLIGAHLQTHQLDSDAKAALYHIHDVCDEGDKLEIVTPPTRVSLGKFSAGIVGYRGVVRVTSPKGRSAARAGSGSGSGSGSGVGLGLGGAVAGSSSEGQLTSTVTLWYLVVRLVEQETDLVVFVNVPREEFEKAGDLRGLEAEERLAEGLISGLVDGLEVVDWDLFC